MCRTCVETINTRSCQNQPAAPPARAPGGPNVPHLCRNRPPPPQPGPSKGCWGPKGTWRGPSKAYCGSSKACLGPSKGCWGRWGLSKALLGPKQGFLRPQPGLLGPQQGRLGPKQGSNPKVQALGFAISSAPRPY